MSSVSLEIPMSKHQVRSPRNKKGILALICRSAHTCKQRFPALALRPIRGTGRAEGRVEHGRLEGLRPGKEYIRNYVREVRECAE